MASADPFSGFLAADSENGYNGFIYGQNAIAQGAVGAGSNLLTKGGGLQNLSSDFFKKLLKGNRTQLMSTLAPEVEALNSGFDSAEKSIANFGPRSGGATSKLADLKFKKAGATTQMLQNAQSGAAQTLFQQGTAESGQGIGLLGLAGNNLNSALQGMISDVGLTHNIDQQNFQNGQQIGQQIGELLVALAG